MKKEKHSEERVKKNILVYIENGGYELLGESSNLSSYGLFIESPYSLDAQTHVILTLATPPGAIEIEGKVCWVKYPEDKLPLHIPPGMGIQITRAPVEYRCYIDTLRHPLSSYAAVC